MSGLLNQSTTQVKPIVEPINSCWLEFRQHVGMANAAAVGRLVKALRRDRGVGQVVLADAVGVARSTIAGIEAGHAMPGRETLTALADYFGVPLDRLRHGDAAPGEPRPREVAQDADELALLEFWRGLSEEQRRLVLRLLQVPERRPDAA